MYGVGALMEPSNPARQIGQVLPPWCPSANASQHDVWKKWPQTRRPRRVRTLVERSQSASKQMQHSACSTASLTSPGALTGLSRPTRTRAHPTRA